MSDSPQSPPKDIEQGVQSPEEEQMNEPQDPQSGGLAYAEFEVKEQDRWLPIANGKPYSPFPPTTTTTTMFGLLVRTRQQTPRTLSFDWIGLSACCSLVWFSLLFVFEARRFRRLFCALESSCLTIRRQSPPKQQALLVAKNMMSLTLTYETLLQSPAL